MVCRTRWMQEWRNEGLKGCRKGQMKKRRDSGLERVRTRWIQISRDTGKEGSVQEGYGTGEMLDRTGQNGCKKGGM